MGQASARRPGRGQGYASGDNEEIRASIVLTDGDILRERESTPLAQYGSTQPTGATPCVRLGGRHDLDVGGETQRDKARQGVSLAAGLESGLTRGAQQFVQIGIYPAGRRQSSSAACRVQRRTRGGGRGRDRPRPAPSRGTAACGGARRIEFVRVLSRLSSPPVTHARLMQ